LFYNIQVHKKQAYSAGYFIKTITNSHDYYKFDTITSFCCIIIQPYGYIVENLLIKVLNITSLFDLHHTRMKKESGFLHRKNQPTPRLFDSK